MSDAMRSSDADKAEDKVDTVINKVVYYDKRDLLKEDMSIEGSVKTGTKVASPDEFDYSWALRPKEFKLSRHGIAWINRECERHKHTTESACMHKTDWKKQRVAIPYGNVSLYCVHTSDANFKTVSVDGCIPPRAISKYVHERVTKAEESCHYDINVSDHVHGPAITFSIKHKMLDHKISVDITPRLDVKFSDLEERTQNAIKKRIESFHPRIQGYLCKRGNVDDPRRLYLVPKSHTAWSLSFANFENVIINKFGETNKSKRVIRRVKKKLKHWKKKKSGGKSVLSKVSSYLLKTIFLEMIIDKPDDDQWTREDIDDNVEELFRRLLSYADDGELPAFFDRSINLLENIKQDTISNLIDFIREEIVSESEDSDDDY